MGSIFLSHTRKDKIFMDKFDTIVARTEVEAFRSELEDIPRPAWKTIKERINESNALFLLVGQKLVDLQESHDEDWDFTQNWIAYEIGIACQKEIDVWVICDKNVGINFPVPYLSVFWPDFDYEMQC
jgi:hypothetical protein